MAGCTDREKVEAEMLVERMEAIDVREGGSSLRERVRELEGLPLQAEPVTVVRDTCVAGYQALIESESKQDEVSRRIAEAEEAKARGEDNPLSAAEVALLSQALNDSMDGIRKAGERINECESRVARLASKHDLKK